jgi:hypothetical protein
VAATKGPNPIYATGLPDGYEAVMWPPSTRVHILYRGVEFVKLFLHLFCYCYPAFALVIIVVGSGAVHYH